MSTAPSTRRVVAALLSQWSESRGGAIQAASCRLLTAWKPQAEAGDEFRMR